MEFEIYKEEEDVTKLRLMYNECGSMCITAVDDDGKSIVGGSIAIITIDGALWLSKNIDPKLGFQLDEDGRIKIEK